MSNVRKFHFLTGSERAYLGESFSSNFARELMVPAIFASVIFITGLFLSQPGSYNPINPQLMDLASGVGAFTIFAVARFIKRTGTLVNLFIWIAAGSIAAFSTDLLILTLTGKFDVATLSQLPVGVVAYSTNIVLVAGLWAGIRIGQTRTKLLSENLKSLEETESTLQDQLSTMRGEIRSSVDAELASVANLLEHPTNSSSKQLSDSVMDAIDQVIRPLSHRLAGFGLKNELPTVSGAPKQLPMRGVAWSRLAGPEFYFFLFIIFILPASFFVSGLSASLTISALLLVQVLNLAWVERTFKGFYVNRWVGMGLNLLAATLFTLAYVVLCPSEAAFGVGWGFMTISLAVSGLLALVSKRVDTLTRLSVVNHQKLALVTKLRQEVWVTKTRFAKAIHGAVQAKFLAIALRLGTNTSDLSIDAAKQDLREATLAVAESLEASTNSFSESFDDYRKAWAGVVELTLLAEPETIVKLDANPITRSCVLETIGEAVANAAKHSKSPAVKLQLTTEANEFIVKVSSQGSLASVNTKSGYGSQILDEVTNSWSLTSSGNVVTLEAKFLLT